MTAIIPQAVMGAIMIFASLVSPLSLLTLIFAIFGGIILGIELRSEEVRREIEGKAKR